MSERKATECKVGELEQMSRYGIFRRTLNFVKGEQKVHLTGHMSGLIALLMNAADAHYKKFNLISSKIQVRPNPADLNETREVHVDEWQLEDKREGFMVHFFFERVRKVKDKDGKWRSSQDSPIDWDWWEKADATRNSALQLSERLVRIEVRDEALANELADSDIDANLENKNGDYGLLAQFDIVELRFEMKDQEEEGLLFEPPSICQGKKPDSKQDDESDGDDSNWWEGFWDGPDNQFDNFIPSADSEGDSDREDHDEKTRNDHLDEFEFASSMMEQLREFPKFDDFIEAQPAYEIESELSLIGDNKDFDHSYEYDFKENLSKSVYMSESMDFQQETGMIKLFHSKTKFAAKEFFEYYHIKYSSELAFKVVDNRCHYLENMDSNWLMLLSSPMTYYTYSSETSDTTSNARGPEITVESNKLRLYGIGALWRRAAESEQTRYLGSLRRRIEDPLTGTTFRQLVWQMQEFAMQIRFIFLMDEKKYQSQPPDLPPMRESEYMRLYFIQVRNIYDEYLVTDFPEIHIKPLKIEGLSSQPVHLPDICMDVFHEINRLHSRDEKEEPLPRWEHLLQADNFDSLGSYKYTYIISHALNEMGEKLLELNSDDIGGMRSSSVFVREIFEPKNNRAKLIITKDENTVETYIDGEDKQVYMYIAEGNMCKKVGTIKPLVDIVGLGDAIENTNFAADQYYGLGAMYNQLSKHDAKLAIHFRTDKTGHRVRVYTYTITARDPKTGAAQVVKIGLLKKRPTTLTQSQRVPLSSVKVRNEERFELNSITIEPEHTKKEMDQMRMSFVAKFLGPMVDFGHSTAADQLKRHYNTRISVAPPMLAPSEVWRLPAACKTAASEEKGSEGSGDAPIETGPTHDDVTGDKFPQLENLLARVNEIHFYSEVSVMTIDPDLKKSYDIYTLNEWIHNGHLRMQLRRHRLDRDNSVPPGEGSGERKRDFSFVLYSDTQEVFDLSRPYNCKNELPKSFLQSSDATIPPSNLIDVWSSLMSKDENSQQINHLANVYFAPLTLWRLAQRNLDNVQLANQIKLAPLPVEEQVIMELNAEQLDRVMRQETWRVNSPKDSDYKWSYDLNFVKHQQVKDDGSTVSWHVLDSVVINNPGTLKSSTDPLTHHNVRVDVLNYNYKPIGEAYSENFLLPEGWGCKRKMSSDPSEAFLDDFLVDTKFVPHLAYEASLDVVYTVGDDDEDPLGPIELGRYRMPTVTGSYLSVGGILGDEQTKSEGEYDDKVIAHYWSTHYPDGTLEAVKIVSDNPKSLMYVMDEKTGACRVVLSSAQNASTKVSEVTPTFVLPFPESNLKSHAIRMTDELFEKLFVNTYEQGYSRLNEHTIDATVYTTYEQSYESLSLTDQITGPATVVRRFSHTKHEPMRVEFFSDAKRNIKVGTKIHDVVTVQVFSFSRTGRRLRAVFDLTLFKGPPIHIDEYLRTIDITQCLTDGSPGWQSKMASYTVEYPINRLDLIMSVPIAEAVVRDSFYYMLMKNVKLSPLQLDGKARVDFDQRDNVMRIHFDVLDAQPSHLQFKQIPEATMSDELSIKAETKLSPTLFDCSSWCDHLGAHCVAMSYCQDRRCRVLNLSTPLSYRKKESDKKETDDGRSKRNSLLMEWIATGYQSDYACTYYYRDSPWAAVTLERFRSFMHREINIARKKTALQKLALNIVGGLDGTTSIEPLRFIEAHNEFRVVDSNTPVEGDRDASGADEDDNDLIAVHPVLAAQLDPENEFQRALVDWMENSRLDFNKIDTSIANAEGNVLSIKTEVQLSVEEAHCFERCLTDSSCVVFNYCGKIKNCGQIFISTDERSSSDDESRDLKIIESLNNTLRLLESSATVHDDDDDCHIYMRDYLVEYVKFENTFVPENFHLRMEDTSSMECAALCHSGENGECLSFDVCYTSESSTEQEAKNDRELITSLVNNPKRKGICFMQKSHVELDTFERGKLLPAYEAVSGLDPKMLDGKKASCDHYSKLVSLSEYKKIEHRKWALGMPTTIRGDSLERCAIDCQQEDECLAFEYCLNERLNPTQSCYLIKNSDKRLEQIIGDDSQIDAKAFGNMLKVSRICSIYVARRRTLAEKLTNMIRQKEPSLNLNGHDVFGRNIGHELAHLASSNRFTIPVLWAGLYVSVALIVGTVARIAYIRIRAVSATGHGSWSQMG